MKPELMSPIKNRASLQACKNYTDAVYFSASRFSMRTGADNLTLKELPEFVSECHKNKIKAYLTLNSVVYNQELKEIERTVKKAKQSKVDALIVWDPSLIKLAKLYDLDFFISTQANVSNYESANFYKKLGAKRIILSRELTLEQIREIKKKTDMKIEVFIHGAMCLSISGRCILSSYFENKSANRGSCYQICRRKWNMMDDHGNKLEIKGKNFLSPKDLCMIEYIPELIESGVNSFKIEGRQRDPRYIETCSKIYKKAIDAYYNNTFSKKKALEWKKELKKVYNRNFTTGFYFGTPGKEGINFDHSGTSATSKKILIGKITHYYSKNKVASLFLNHQGIEVGETISVEGKNTYLEQKIESMEINRKKVNKVKKGEEVGIKVKERVRKNDKVFAIKD